MGECPGAVLDREASGAVAQRTSQGQSPCNDRSCCEKKKKRAKKVFICASRKHKIQHTHDTRRVIVLDPLLDRAKERGSGYTMPGGY